MNEEKLKLLYEEFIKESNSKITFDVFKTVYEILEVRIEEEIKKHFK